MDSQPPATVAALAWVAEQHTVRADALGLLLVGCRSMTMSSLRLPVPVSLDAQGQPEAGLRQTAAGGIVKSCGSLVRHDHAATSLMSFSGASLGRSTSLPF